MKKLLFIFIFFIVGCASTPKVEWLNIELSLEESPYIYPSLIGDSLEIDSLKNRMVIVGLKENGDIVWKVKKE